MHSPDYAVGRCLSVSLYVRHTPVLSVNGYTVTHILKVFYRRLAPPF